MGADKTVRVVFFGQKQKLNAAHIAGVGQSAVQGFARRTPACAVAVKAEHHCVGKAEKLLHMVWRAGGAQGRYRIGKSQLRQGHHVHIALGHQHIAFFSQIGPRFKQAVKLAPFAEHRGFWRVEVFGFFITQHAAAKADALAFDIAYGEHDPVAKAVVALFFAAFFGIANDQATFDQQRIVVLREDAGQAAPALGRISQTKALGHFTREATSFEVGDRARRIFELAPVGVPCFFQHAGEGVLFFFLLLRPGAVLWRGLLLRHLHAKLLRQILHCLDKTHACVVHQKANGIAVFAAAKAMEKLLAGADREGRGFFAMKRAQAHEIGPPFF